MSPVSNARTNAAVKNSLATASNQSTANELPFREASQETIGEALNAIVKDMRKSSMLLDKKQTRYLVDTYYLIQGQRKRTGNQIIALRKSGEPTDTLELLFSINKSLEAFIKKVLDYATSQTQIGQWLREITGIGPVLAAGLTAHIDINIAKTSGAIWRFAGYDVTLKWVGAEESKKWIDEWIAAQATERGVTKKTIISEGVTNDLLLAASEFCGQKAETLYKNAVKFSEKFKEVKRETIGEDGEIIETTEKEPVATFESFRKAMSLCPFNRKLKTICWLIGKSFQKSCNNPKSLYGRLYKSRKAWEKERSDRGVYKDQALARAEEVGKGTQAYGWYSKGQLSPAHIDERARRWAVKIFLAHLFEVWHKMEFKKEPVKPYVIAYLNHVHEIMPEVAYNLSLKDEDGVGEVISDSEWIEENEWEPADDDDQYDPSMKVESLIEEMESDMDGEVA